jgi:hypothetical protein
MVSDSDGDDSLLPRPKLDCDGGYDAAIKGASVVASSPSSPSSLPLLPLLFLLSLFYEVGRGRENVRVREGGDGWLFWCGWG